MRTRFIVSFLLFLSVFLPTRPGWCQTSSSFSAFEQGYALFQSRDYRGALDKFTQAIRENPGDPKSFSYLGSCQEALGDMENAALNFYRSNRILSNPTLKARADGLKAKLSLEEQKWVEEQLKKPAPGTADLPAASSAPAKVSFGVRVIPGLCFFSLTDFISIRDGMQAFAHDWNEYYSVNDVYLESSIPSMSPVVEINPFIAFGPGLELGAGFNLFFIDPVNLRLNSFLVRDYFFDDRFEIGTFQVNGRLRAYIPKGKKDILQIFLEPSLGIQPVNLKFEETYQHSAATPPDNQRGGEFNATGLAAGLNLGCSLQAARGFIISFSGGYQYAEASDYHGTWFDQAWPVNNNVPGTLQILKDPISGSDYWIFVPDDQAHWADFGIDSGLLSYVSPLSLNFSGLRFHMDLSFIF